MKLHKTNCDRLRCCLPFWLSCNNGLLCSAVWVLLLLLNMPQEVFISELTDINITVSIQLICQAVQDQAKSLSPVQRVSPGLADGVHDKQVSEFRSDMEPHSVLLCLCSSLIALIHCSMYCTHCHMPRLSYQAALALSGDGTLQTSRGSLCRYRQLHMAAAC